MRTRTPLPPPPRPPSGRRGLKACLPVVPRALASVEQKRICGFFNRSMRILEAYRDNIQCGCGGLEGCVCKSL